MFRRMFAAVALLGTAMPVLAQTQAPNSDLDSRKISDGITEEYVRAYNAGSAAGVAATFAQGATFVTPAGPVLHGRQAIEAAISSRINAGWTRQTASASEAYRMDNAIWAVGNYMLTGSGPMEGKTINGRYTHIIRREGDAWRTILLMGNILPQQDPTGMSGTSAR